MTVTGIAIAPATRDFDPSQRPARVAALLRALRDEVGLHDGSEVGTLVARLAALEAVVDTDIALATSGTPAAIGTAARGTGVTAARDDHVHAADTTGVTTTGLTAGDWATSVPATITIALNRLSAKVKALNAGTAIP